MIRRRAPVALLMLAPPMLGAACDGHAQATPPPAAPPLARLLENRLARAPLPDRLSEVSGLALDATGRVWAHDDERGVIYRLDPRTGDILDRRVLGPPRATGDFEGLAFDGERFHLVTSAGTLVSFRAGTAEDVPDYGVHETGAGSWCEVEGLAYDPRGRALVLACKTVRARAHRGETLLLRVPLPDSSSGVGPGARPEPSVEVELTLGRDVLRAAGLPAPLRLSGVAYNAPRDTWIVVAAQQHRVVEVTREGTILSSVHLKSSRHPQTEGVEIDPDGLRLLLTDEGRGERARITTYGRPAPSGGGR